MPDVIACGKCERKFAWKPELAGKRVRCKCGEPIAVPAAKSAAKPMASKPVAAPVKKPARPKPADDDGLDGLIALAEDAERAAAALPVEVVDFAPVPVEPIAVKKVSRNLGAGVPGVPLGYQSGPTARERNKQAAASAALIDPIRDVYAPLGMIAAGFVIYMAYFGFRYHLASGGLAVVGIGVSMLTIIKAVLLVAFALVAAGPLGVSFGGLWTAILKLAAIAIFVDAICAWVDMGIAHISGGAGGGGFGFGVIGWPVALGLYWGSLIYLFSMDPGDSWMVVVILAVFDRIIRALLTILLLEMVLGWGGVASPVPRARGMAMSANTASSAQASEMATHIDDLKQADQLLEAKKYLAGGRQAAAVNSVNAWYNAGCPNMWYEMSRRDINGHREAMALIIELPDAPAQRVKCYDILKGYYKEESMPSDPSDFIDTGEQYMEVGFR